MVLTSSLLSWGLVDPSRATDDRNPIGSQRRLSVEKRLTELAHRILINPKSLRLRINNNPSVNASAAHLEGQNLIRINYTLLLTIDDVRRVFEELPFPHQENPNEYSTAELMAIHHALQEHLRLPPTDLSYEDRQGLVIFLKLAQDPVRWDRAQSFIFGHELAHCAYRHSRRHPPDQVRSDRLGIRRIISSVYNFFQPRRASRITSQLAERQADRAACVLFHDLGTADGAKYFFETFSTHQEEERSKRRRLSSLVMMVYHRGLFNYIFDLINSAYEISSHPTDRNRIAECRPIQYLTRAQRETIEAQMLEEITAIAVR